EQDEDKKAWIVKTTIDAYADCLESGLTVEDVCSRVSQDVDVSDNNHRADLFARLQKELAGAFEPKLADHIAYAIFVRMVAEQYSETPAEEFKLRYSVAHAAFQDGEYCGEMPSAPEHLHAVVECTRSIFPEDPLIANQLASKIATLAMGVFEYGCLQRISHHYFLAGEIKHLLASARSACDNSGPVQRIARLHGYRGDHVYANDIRIIDTLYRAACARYRVQPCVDAERVV
ncbi:MAG TPA: hypothetical protein O0X27_05930, partial [Methanocorpusculum sp.]|nr:hypothetical protein [Methanocorpusculum sp.]